MDVWILGRIAYDLFATEIGVPLPEAKSFSRHVGGSSANIAVGLARLGLKVGMIASVGDDLFADYFTSFMNQEGIDTRFVTRVAGFGTQLCVGEVRPPFRQVFYRHRPADTQLRIGREELDALSGGRLFLTNGTSLSEEPSRESTLEALRAARAASVTTVFDVDYRYSSWPSAEEAGRVARGALGALDIVIGNQDEIPILTGERDPTRSVDVALGAGPKLVVRKLGADGVSAHTRDAVVTVPPLRVEVLSTVGAGDGFAAGFLSAYLEKLPLHECLLRGNAAAAIVVSRVSCSDAMPRRQEIQELLANAR